MDIIRLLFGMESLLSVLCFIPLSALAAVGILCWALYIRGCVSRFLTWTACLCLRRVLADSSVQCSSMAMEECALNAHETKNVVCCAKHHSPVPCTSCAENERLVKEAVKKREEEDRDEQEKRKGKEDQGDKDEMT